MRLIENQDTALLNSDVIVPPDWLIRLEEEAYSRPEVTTEVGAFPERLSGGNM